MGLGWGEQGMECVLFTLLEDRKEGVSPELLDTLPQLTGNGTTGLRLTGWGSSEPG